MKSLTEKRKRFCEEYLIDFNGTAAAIRAGFSKKGARQEANRLLTNADIQKYLAQLKTEAKEQYNITKERVLQEIIGKAFTPLNAFSKWGPDGLEIKSSDELTPIELASLKKIRFTEKITKKGDRYIYTDIEQHSNERALDFMAKYVGLTDGPLSDDDLPPMLVVPSELNYEDWLKQAKILRERAATIEHDTMKELGEIK